jgi:hypothetical protein
MSPRETIAISSGLPEIWTAIAARSQRLVAGVSQSIRGGSWWRDHRRYRGKP